MHRTLPYRSPAMLLAAGAGGAGGIPAGRSQDDSRRVTVTDLDGRSVQPLATARQRGTRSRVRVHAVRLPDRQPLRARARAPAAAAAAASIEFWLVFVDPGESVGAIRDTCGVRLYRAARFMTRARSGARHRRDDRPEAAVFARDLAGRGSSTADDRRSLSGRGPDASSRDHARSGGRIDELRRARVPVLRETQAVGCVIADLR